MFFKKGPVAKFGGSVEQVFAGGEDLWFEGVGGVSLIVDVRRPKDVGEEIDRRELIPRRGQYDIGVDGFEILLADGHVVIPVPDEVGRHRGSADLAIVEDDNGSRRFSLDGQCSSYTTERPDQARSARDGYHEQAK